MSQIEKRLAELGIVLPKPAAPVANYVPYVRTGGMAPGALPQLWVSGQLPLGPDGKLEERHKGKLGPEFAHRRRARGGGALRDQHPRPGAGGAR